MPVGLRVYVYTELFTYTLGCLRIHWAETKLRSQAGSVRGLFPYNAVHEGTIYQNSLVLHDLHLRFRSCLAWMKCSSFEASCACDADMPF